MTDIAGTLESHRKEELQVPRQHSTQLLSRRPTLPQQLVALHYYLSFALYWVLIWSGAIWLCVRRPWLWLLFVP